MASSVICESLPLTSQSFGWRRTPGVLTLRAARTAVCNLVHSRGILRGCAGGRSSWAATIVPRLDAKVQSPVIGEKREPAHRAFLKNNISEFLQLVKKLSIFPRARSGLTESRGIPKAARVRLNLLAFDWRPAGMARAYSLDLRERVVGAVAAGQTCRSVAKTFMVSVASVVKWSQRQRAVGSPAALKMGGHRPYLVARERDWVLARIAEKPDLTLRALLKELADRGLVVSYYALWHFLHHEGVTFKKKPSRLRTGPPGRRQAA